MRALCSSDYLFKTNHRPLPGERQLSDVHGKTIFLHTECPSVPTLLSPISRPC
jgi:hypothetical protein